MRNAQRLQQSIKRYNESTDADHRRIYKEFDADREKYGQRAADFNAGFLEGEQNILEKVAGIKKTLLSGKKLNAKQLKVLRTL